MVTFAPLASEAASQLDVDLVALEDGLSPSEFEIAVVSTPSVLRRVAARLGPLVAPGTDRVCASGPAGAALAIAVSLHTGVPAAIFDGAGTALSEIHAGERVVVVSMLGGSGADALADALETCGHDSVTAIVGLEGRQ